MISPSFKKNFMFITPNLVIWNALETHHENNNSEDKLNESRFLYLTIVEGAGSQHCWAVPFTVSGFMCYCREPMSLGSHPRNSLNLDVLEHLFSLPQMQLYFSWKFILLKIPAHTKKGTLILVPSISETQKVSTSLLLLNKKKQRDLMSVIQQYKASHGRQHLDIVLCTQSTI